MTLVPFIAGESLFSSRDFRDEAGRMMIATGELSNPLTLDYYSGFSSSTDTGGVAISPDGKWGMVSINNNPRILSFNTELDALQDPFGGALTQSPTAIRFSPLGDQIAIAYPASPFIELWSYPGFVNQGVFTDLPISKINDLQWTPDGTKIVAISDDAPFIHVWDPTTRASIAPTFTNPPTADVDFLAVSNTLIMATGPDTGANKKAYDIVSGSNVFSDTVDGWVCDFSPDGSTLFMQASSFQDQLRVYNTSDWSFVDQSYSSSVVAAGIFNNVNSVRTMKALDNDHVLFHMEGVTFLFNVSTEQVVHAVKNFVADIGRMAFHPDTAIGFIQGTVDDGSGNFLERYIVAMDRATGRMVGRTRSDPIDGTYTLTLLTRQPVTLFSFGAGTELTKLSDDVTPASAPTI